MALGIEKTDNKKINYYNLIKDNDKYYFVNNKKKLEENYIIGKINKIKLVIKDGVNGKPNRYLIYIFFEDKNEIDCIAVNLNQTARTILNIIASDEFDINKETKLKFSENRNYIGIFQDNVKIKWKYNSDVVNKKILNKMKKADEFLKIKFIYDLVNEIEKKGIKVEKEIEDNILEAFENN